MGHVLFNPNEVTVKRSATFTLPLKFTGLCTESNRSGSNGDGEYIIARFKGDKVTEDIIQHEGVWAGWFLDQNISGFSDNLKMMVAAARKPKFTE